MNKKLTSLLLAALLTAGSLVGCSSKAEEEDVATADTEQSVRVSMTLTLALPTKSGTTDEAAQKVEAAINRLTQAKFDTAIDLRLIPENEYQAYIDDTLSSINTKILEEESAAESRRKEIKALKAQGVDVSGMDTGDDEETTETVETEEETIVNDLGISIKQYPEVGDTQFDIFLVQGYDNYNSYIENEYIQQLDSELSGNSKLLKTYIYPTFLELANVSGTYAIPNNHPVGQYQYLLVNKELVDTYDYDPDELTTLLKCTDFIKDIGNQHLDGVVPLLGEVEPANMTYWGTDQSQWSILASQITNTMSYKLKLVPKSVFSINVFVNTIGAMKELSELGYIGDGTIKDGEKFAVGVVAGDASIVEQYGDEYYTYIYSKPMMTEEDAYGNMLAVSTYSKNLSRAMEIITYINTSTDIRTILQYGIEGENWEYENQDTQDTIRILNNDYQMDLVTTGNVYMTYPGEGMSMDYWDYGKQQNIDSISSPYIKFKGYINDNNKDLIKQLDDLSKEYKAKLDALTYAEFDDAISEYKKELKESELFKQLTDLENENSVASIYSTWHDDLYPPET
ncbi:MAG: hypothetical protein SOT59_02450 [Eubacteriales bacterium]|nr:hypothetical protein [Clostridia bacterium]MDY2845004.1 hypothetical protein [Eubacteriales bacterium]